MDNTLDQVGLDRMGRESGVAWVSKEDQDRMRWGEGRRKQREGEEMEGEERRGKGEGKANLGSRWGLYTEKKQEEGMREGISGVRSPLIPWLLHWGDE